MTILSRQMQRGRAILQRQRKDDEGRGTRRFNKEEEGVRGHRKSRGLFVGDLETPSSRLIKELGGGVSDSKNTT